MPCLGVRVVYERRVLASSCIVQVTVDARKSGRTASLDVDQESIPDITVDDDVTDTDLDLRESSLYFAGVPLTSRRFAKT